VAIVKQLTVVLDNRPGSLARLCSELAKLAVNISAIHATEGNPVGPVRMVVSNIGVAERVCDALGLKYFEDDVLAAHVGDRPGSLGKLTRKLAEKNINIDYVYGSIEKGASRALLILGVSDVEAAARLLR
jgi:hypothetical protein